MRRIAQCRSWSESGCILTASIQRCGTMTLGRYVANLYLISLGEIFCQLSPWKQNAGRSSRCNHKHMLQAVLWYRPLLKKVTSRLDRSTTCPIRLSFQNQSSLKHASSMNCDFRLFFKGWICNGGGLVIDRNCQIFLLNFQKVFHQFLSIVCFKYCYCHLQRTSAQFVRKLWILCAFHIASNDCPPIIAFSQFYTRIAVS